MIKTLITLAVSAITAFGATYYVATTGNDTTGDGSFGNPWRNIRKGVLSMSAGDTLQVRGGTYDSDGSLLQEFDSGVNPATPTIIESYPGEWAIYRASADFQNMVLLSGKSNVVIRNFEFYADSQSASNVKIQSGSQHITFSNVTFRACRDGHGLLVVPTAAGSEIGGHLITHCSFLTNGFDKATGDSPLHQIYLQNSSNIVEHSFIHASNDPADEDNIQYGIHLFRDDAVNCIFRGNWITNCGNAGIGVVADGHTNVWIYNNVFASNATAIKLFNSTNCYVMNNTCASNVLGIYSLESKDCEIANNICVLGQGNNPGGIYVNASTGIVVRNNLSYGSQLVNGNRIYDYREFSSSGTVTNGNKFAYTESFGPTEIYNAFFVELSSWNLHISANSDAIGSALTQTVFLDDYDQNLRTVPWDMGAFEYLRAPTELRSITLSGGSIGQ